MKNETELESPEVDSSASGTGQDTTDQAEGERSAELTWSPGVLVKRAREARKFSLEALSLQTKLSMRVLRALEADDFDALSEPVFVRGYYRRCAHVLGLPSGEVVKAYERASGEPPPRPMPIKTGGGEEDLQPPRRWLPYMIFALVAGALIALAMWWGEQNMADNLLGSEAAMESPPVGSPARSPADDFPILDDLPSSPAPQVAESDSGEAQTPETAPEQSQPDVAVTGEPATPAAPAAPVEPVEPATSEVAPVAAGGGDVRENGASAPDATLVVNFTQKSWVRITDATGDRLLNGLISGGTRRALTGEPPFNVLLGYAPGVDMSLDGRHISLAPYIQSNNTARLTVDGS